MSIVNSSRLTSYYCSAEAIWDNFDLGNKSSGDSSSLLASLLPLYFFMSKNASPHAMFMNESLLI